MRRPREIDGFTLFHNFGKGWQMSVRRKDEPGWDVKIISAEQAEAILSLLETSGHPDGPWTVKPNGSVEEEFWYLRRALHDLAELVKRVEATL